MAKENSSSNDLSKKAPPTHPAAVSSRRNWLLIILGALIVFGFPIIYVLFAPVEESYTPEELYLANFEAFPLENKEALDTSVHLQNAFQLYQEGKYLAAIDSMQPFLATQSNDDLLFYQSIAQLATDQNSDALINLSQMIEDQQTTYKVQAKWYLALTYLKIGAEEEARMLLSELAAQPEGFKKNRSAAILHLLTDQE